MTDPKGAASADAATTPQEDLAPTQAEIDAWAAREKARREAWLRGPTDEERAEYAQHVRQRRLAHTFDMGEQRIEDTVRQGLRLGREGQLAAEGAAYLMYRWSRRTFSDWCGPAATGSRTRPCRTAAAGSRSTTTSTERGDPIRPTLTSASSARSDPRATEGDARRAEASR